MSNTVTSQSEYLQTGTNRASKTFSTDINLVCGADENFAMPLTVVLFSALDNLHQDSGVNIFVLDAGISVPTKAKVERVLRRVRPSLTITWVGCDVGRFKGYQQSTFLSLAAYLRIIIPEVLPKEIVRAVYLDCDMLVKKDISFLSKIDFGSAAALAVQDFAFPFGSEDGAFKRTYCNTGLLVMNLEYWRSNDLSKKIIEYLSKNKTTLYDQDAINAIIDGNWKLLDPRWNCTWSSLGAYEEKFGKSQLSEITLTDIVANPYIIHYTSAHKPWHSGLRSKEALTRFYFHHSFRSEYIRYVQLSGWYGPISFCFWKSFRIAVVFLYYKLPRRLKLFLKIKK